MTGPSNPFGVLYCREFKTRVPVLVSSCTYECQGKGEESRIIPFRCGSVWEPGTNYRFGMRSFVIWDCFCPCPGSRSLVVSSPLIGSYPNHGGIGSRENSSVVVVRGQEPSTPVPVGPCRCGRSWSYQCSFPCSLGLCRCTRVQ